MKEIAVILPGRHVFVCLLTFGLQKGKLWPIKRNHNSNRRPANTCAYSTIDIDIDIELVQLDADSHSMKFNCKITISSPLPMLTAHEIAMCNPCPCPRPYVHVGDLVLVWSNWTAKEPIQHSKQARWHPKQRSMVRIVAIKPWNLLAFIV